MCKPLAPGRVRGRALAASVLRDSLAALVLAGVDDATQRAVAEHLEVSHTHVQRLCGDGAPAVALGDILALPPEIAAAVLRAALVAIAPPPPAGTTTCPQAIALSALCRVGKLAGVAQEVMADGRVTRGEWLEVDRHLDALEADTAQARAAVRAAIGGRR